MEIVLVKVYENPQVLNLMAFSKVLFYSFLSFIINSSLLIAISMTSCKTNPQNSWNCLSSTVNESSGLSIIVKLKLIASSGPLIEMAPNCTTVSI